MVSMAFRRFTKVSSTVYSSYSVMPFLLFVPCIIVTLCPNNCKLAIGVTNLLRLGKMSALLLSTSFNCANSLATCRKLTSDQINGDSSFYLPRSPKSWFFFMGLSLTVPLLKFLAFGILEFKTSRSISVWVHNSGITAIDSTNMGLRDEGEKRLVSLGSSPSKDKKRSEGEMVVKNLYFCGDSAKTFSGPSNLSTYVAVETIHKCCSPLRASNLEIFPDSHTPYDNILEGSCIESLLELDKDYPKGFVVIDARVCEPRIPIVGTMPDSTIAVDDQGRINFGGLVKVDGRYGLRRCFIVSSDTQILIEEQFYFLVGEIEVSSGITEQYQARFILENVGIFDVGGNIDGDIIGVVGSLMTLLGSVESDISNLVALCEEFSLLCNPDQVHLQLLLSSCYNIDIDQVRREKLAQGTLKKEAFKKWHWSLRVRGVTFLLKKASPTFRWSGSIGVGASILITLKDHTVLWIVLAPIVVCSSQLTSIACVLCPQDVIEEVVANLWRLLFSSPELQCHEAWDGALQGLFEAENIKYYDAANQAIQPLVEMLRTGSEKEQQAAIGVVPAGVPGCVEVHPVQMGVHPGFAHLARRVCELGNLVQHDRVTSKREIEDQCMQPSATLKATETILGEEGSQSQVITLRHIGVIAAYYRMLEEERITQPAAILLMQSINEALDLALSQKTLLDWKGPSAHVCFPTYARYPHLRFVPEKLMSFLIVKRLELDCYICAAFLWVHRITRSQLLDFIVESKVIEIVIQESEAEGEAAKQFLEDVHVDLSTDAHLQVLARSALQKAALLDASDSPKNQRSLVPSKDPISAVRSLWHLGNSPKFPGIVLPSYSAIPLLLFVLCIIVQSELAVALTNLLRLGQMAALLLSTSFNCANTLATSVYMESQTASLTCDLESHVSSHSAIYEELPALKVLDLSNSRIRVGSNSLPVFRHLRTLVLNYCGLTWEQVFQHFSIVTYAVKTSNLQLITGGDAEKITSLH
eukprot:Gb_40245 [translate_table: standard]